MGLIKAALVSGGSVLADQWKEFFTCDALPEYVMMAKGQKGIGSRSSNTKGSDNVISNGSVVCVADGQCMLIVDQGRVVEFCAEPGEFVYNSSLEPSVFVGPLGESIKKSFATFGRRVGFGGDAGRDQRVYYINTKELMGNKYGTRSAVPFRVVDKNIGLDMDISVRCHGEYSYRIVDPILFYKNVCGNEAEEYRRDRIDSQLKSEILTALGPAFAKVSAMGIRYSEVVGHSMEIGDALNDVLSEKWGAIRGLQIVSFGVSTLKASEEDEEMIKQMQRMAVYRDPSMAGAFMATSQGDAMKAAAANENGAMMGFMGMGMAQQAGGINANQLFQLAQEQRAAAPAAPQAPAAPAAEGWRCACGAVATGKFCPECGTKKPEPKPQNGWTCPGCGCQATGNFCPDCGTKKPEPKLDGWQCACGMVNKGKFCPECGAKKPAGVPQYKCDKCGWQPADPTKAPRFCPECGDPFDAGDIV